MKKEITVTKALSDLNVLTGRIEKETDKLTVLSTKLKFKNVLKDKNINVDDFKNEVKANYQSILDLIKNRDIIKSAIILSNAKTKVVIAGKEYTIAEAIDKKNRIALETDLLMKLKSEFVTKSKQVTNFNDKLEAQIDKEREIMLSGDNAKNKDIVKTAEELATAKRESNSVELVDPLNIEKVINELEDGIMSFKAEVDQQLSVSNAITLIEIDI
jgi:hypothetical phage-related protein